MLFSALAFDFNAVLDTLIDPPYLYILIGVVAFVLIIIIAACVSSSKKKKLKKTAEAAAAPVKSNKKVTPQKEVAPKAVPAKREKIAPVADAPLPEKQKFEDIAYVAPEGQPKYETPDYRVPVEKSELPTYSQPVAPAYNPQPYDNYQPVYDNYQGVSDQPSYAVPSYEQPSYAAPAYSAAVSVEPLYQQPANEAPAYEAPVYEAPAYETPVYEAPAYEEPTYEQPVYESEVAYEEVVEGHAYVTPNASAKAKVSAKAAPKRSMQVIKNSESDDTDSWKVAKIKPVRAAAKSAPAEPAPEAKAPAAKVATVKKAAAPKAATVDVSEVTGEDKPKVVGKYVIANNNGLYQYSLYANNGQLLYESREYASIASCKGGIETFKKNVVSCDYRVDVDKNGGYKYIFKKGNSIYIGESYRTAKAAENSAESVKRFAPISNIVE